MDALILQSNIQKCNGRVSTLRTNSCDTMERTNLNNYSGQEAFLPYFILVHWRLTESNFGQTICRKSDFIENRSTF